MQIDSNTDSKAMRDTGAPLRIAVISNMVDPNVTPIYEALAQREECELLVLYETDVEPNRKWAAPPLLLNHVFLKSKTLDLRRIHPDAFLHLTWGTGRALKGFKPDIVVARGSGIWSSPANISAFLRRKRNGWFFVPWWESFAREKPTLPRRIAGPWVKAFLGRSNRIMACGTRAKNYLQSLGIPDAKIVVAPHAFPHVVSNPSSARAKREHTAGEHKRVLFVGQLIPRKGIDLLLEAFEKLDEQELWIVGDGELAPLVQSAADKNREIRYFGHLPKDEVLQLYADVDVLVVPSRYEVWGLVVDEAQEFGVPVVATDQVGCTDDLIQPEVTGEIVPAENPEELVAAIRRVCAWSPEKRLQCTKATEAIRRSRGIESAVEAYFRLLPAQAQPRIDLS